MITLRTAPGHEDLLPAYGTAASAGADLKSSVDLVIPAGKHARVPTGTWIDRVNYSQLAPGLIPELQIRARSGLAAKFGITLSNAVGTVDADYPDEICVLLWNTGSEDFVIKRGDRIAQVVLNMVARIDNLLVGGKRLGGFGSTGVSENLSI
jgi:dUTP pyrophosphatase